MAVRDCAESAVCHRGLFMVRKGEHAMELGGRDQLLSCTIPILCWSYLHTLSLFLARHVCKSNTPEYVPCQVDLASCIMSHWPICAKLFASMTSIF
jgi:hypothetical protein